MTSVGQSNKTENLITLQGSAAIVSEFFYYGINSILFQRGIYPPEMFTREQQYGLTILVTTDEKVKKYLKGNIIPQLTEWLEEGVVKRICVAIKQCDTNETIERWQFEIKSEKQSTESGDRTSKKDMATIRSEIQGVIRQITATVTFLPLLETPCSFDILFYTDAAVTVPEKMEPSDPCLITNSEEVKLRSFSTSIHKVDGSVSYKFQMM